MTNKNKYQILVVLLFLFGLTTYLNLDGMPLEHPGNIKAADPFYHVTITDITKMTMMGIKFTLRIFM